MIRIALVLRVIGLAGLLVLAIPVHLLFGLLGQSSPMPRCFLRIGGWIVGLRVIVNGTPLRSHVLYAANHVSWTDIFALGGTTGAAFVTKAEVADWPVAGWLARQNGSLFVERQRRGAVVAQGAALRNALADVRPVTLFAEGTTGDGVTLLPFRPSLFEALVPPPPGVLVQPVAVDYGLEAPDAAWVGAEPLATHAGRQLGRWRARTVTLRFGEPIDPHGLDRKTLASACQASVTALLGMDSPRAPSGNGQVSRPSA